MTFDEFVEHKENLYIKNKIMRNHRNVISQLNSRSNAMRACYDQNANPSVIRGIKLTKDKEHKGEFYDGYSIVCDDQTIELLISNSGQCCEEWGYGIKHKLEFNDDFIGAVVENVHWLSDKREQSDAMCSI